MSGIAKNNNNDEDGKVPAPAAAASSNDNDEDSKVPAQAAASSKASSKGSGKSMPKMVMIDCGGETKALYLKHQMPTGEMITFTSGGVEYEGVVVDGEKAITDVMQHFIKAQQERDDRQAAELEEQTERANTLEADLEIAKDTLKRVNRKRLSHKRAAKIQRKRLRTVSSCHAAMTSAMKTRFLGPAGKCNIVEAQLSEMDPALDLEAAPDVSDSDDSEAENVDGVING